ncbi:MAG: FAD-dependent monooxygenase [Rhodospirillaceae bacterium]|nr:FAD-dependent monooxygenase [Rhodospirillaceae bacterium]
MANNKHVVIAGAGPVGCTTALMLAQADIKVTLLEAESELLLDMRASTFHPPSLDMLDRLGVTPALIEQGLITPQFQYRDRLDGLIAEFDLAAISEHTNHPYRLQAEQYKLTRIIVDRLPDYPHVDFQYNARATDLEQNDSSVTVHYDTPDGRQSVSADYFLACDGSNGFARKILNIEFPGFTFPELFLVVSTTDDINEAVPDMCPVAYIMDPEEWVAVIRAPEMWRFMIPTKPEMSDEEILDLDFLESRIQGIAPRDQKYTISHSTLYPVNQRVAETYRQGRVLLAGDSAHLNNPLGGMGMNGGLHDGVNAAEKLIQILNHGASEDLLDLYDRQRRPIAIEYVQAQSIRNKKNLEEKDPAVRKQRQDEIRETLDDPQKSLELMMQVSMLNSINKSNSIT